ncbi:MAG: hypothetical protein P8Z30_18865 [Acidobacteriota bacterium]
MRNTKSNVTILATALALTFFCGQTIAASAAPLQDQPQQAANKEAAQNVSIYRVHYKIDEVENGKTVNSRSYVMMAQTGKTASTRIGGRVPYVVSSGIELQGVAMNIDSTLSDQNGRLLVSTRLMMNVLATKQPPVPSDRAPVFNQMTIDDVTYASLGKPAFVGSLDDVASNRRYVVEVTVTRAM